MKTKYPFLLLTAALAFGTAVALAQDNAKPTPAEPPPAPEKGNRPGEPVAPNPPTASPAPASPAPDGRHGEHHNGPHSPEASRHGDLPGDRHPEGWHHAPGAWPMPAPPKPTSYIGVITAPPPAVLTAQLGLAEGFGLVVGDVLPDSPAAKAGVQRYDVLTKFNDQQLVDSNQFSTLVRAVKKDSDATLTLIRKTQEQTLTVKIEERLLPERRAFPTPGGEFRHMQGMMENGRRIQSSEKSPSAGETPATSNDSASSISPEEILREVRPGGVAQIRLLKPDGNVTYNMANARLLMKDEAGEIEMTIHDGKRSLVARNAQGETIFDGPIDTEEQRKTLPEDVRKKIDLIEVQRKLAEAPALPPGKSGAEPDVQ